jgi:pyruvate/2-oxoacid:ferredoxin oxidoreductase beta subunit
LYHYNPLLAKVGENPFVIDSKVSTAPEDFIGHENRFKRLLREKPDKADLHPRMVEFIKKRFAKYDALSNLFETIPKKEGEKN